MRWHVAIGFAVVMASLAVGEVRGQAPPPGYSPYLNLARPGNAGVNYYGLVRPQVEFRNDLQQLQRNTSRLQSDVGQIAGSDLTTGHAAGFMYFGGFYPGLGRGNLPARSMPSTRPAVAAPVAGYRR